MTLERSAATPVTTPSAPSDARERLRSRVRLASDLVGLALLIAVGSAAAIPLIWGLGLHLLPMVIGGLCGELLCLLVLGNRLLAPRGARQRSVPFYAALEERPAVVAVFLILAVTSALTLLSYWPGATS